MREEDWLKEIRMNNLIVEEHELKLIEEEGKYESGIPRYIIRKILSDEIYYNYFVRCLYELREVYNVFKIVGGCDTAGVCNASIYNIVKHLNIYQTENVLNIEEKERFDNIISLTSYESFIKDSVESYTVNIEGTNYTYEFDEIKKILEYSEDEYKIFIESSKTDTVKQNLLYAVKSYFEKNRTINKYYLPVNIIKRVYELINNISVDLESINKLRKFDNSEIAKQPVNEKLVEELLVNKESYSQIEMAIKIYINMCAMFNYSESFYAANQRGIELEKVEDLKNISNITRENNNVVCYEFNMIYAYLLDKLGIKVYIKTKLMEGYGSGHESLMFVCDKYIVEADAIETLITSDLYNVKVSRDILGLKCINKNEETESSFKKMLNSVYTSYKNDNDIYSYEQFIKLYKDKYQKGTMNFQVKLAMFFRKIKEISLSKVEYTWHIKHIEKLFFSEEEQKNIDVIFLRKNAAPQETENCKLIILMKAMDKIYELSEVESNHYSNSAEVSKEYILDLFKKGLIEFINPYDMKLKDRFYKMLNVPNIEVNTLLENTKNSQEILSEGEKNAR